MTYDIYDPMRRCAKCGSDEVTSDFGESPELRGSAVPGAGLAIFALPHVWCFVKGPHVDRKCRRCGHKWYERPLDYEEAVP